MKIPHLNISVDKYLKKVHYGTHLQPFRDWLVVMGISFLLLIGSVGWSYWLFQEISSGTDVAKMSKGPKAINTNALEEVREIFDKRAAEKAHYLVDYRFVDPSR